MMAIATVYVDQGNVDGAIVLYEKSLQTVRAIGNAHDIAATLVMLARVLAFHPQDFGKYDDLRSIVGHRLSIAIESYSSSRWFSRC